MSPPSRVPQFTRLQQLLAKRYQSDQPTEKRETVLEHLMFAALLENAPHVAANEAFRRLRSEFFDWNEVRVSTVRDLMEVAAQLPDPLSAAMRVKQPLQSLFESSYSFDIEDLRKLTMNQAIERLDKIKGITPFMRSYVVQQALGGHAIPLDDATLTILFAAGLADEKELESRTVAGLERAIPKTKGISFANMLHDWAAAFWANRADATVGNILKEFNRSWRERLEARERQLTQAASAEASPAEVATAAVDSPPNTSPPPAPGKRRGRKPRTIIAAEPPPPKAEITTTQQQEPTASQPEPEPQESDQGRPRPKLEARSARPRSTTGTPSKKSVRQPPQKRGGKTPLPETGQRPSKSQRNEARKSARRKPR